jgi:uncharacterized membrane protein
MKSPASIAGHPLHPILVAFPIGLWTFALVCDLVYHLFYTSYAWKEAALFCTGGGLVGAVAAAVPGVIDFLSISSGGRLRQIAIYHLAVNGAAVILFGYAFWLRFREDPFLGASLAPVWLTAFGLVLVAVGGWFGGEMVYKLRMGVDEGSEDNGKDND